MCLAIAESRGWVVATDDRKAIRVAEKGGLTVISCPQLVKTWVDATRPDTALVVQVLTDIQTLASSGQIRQCPSRIGGPGKQALRDAQTRRVHRAE